MKQSLRCLDFGLQVLLRNFITNFLSVRHLTSPLKVLSFSWYLFTNNSI